MFVDYVGCVCLSIPQYYKTKVLVNLHFYSPFWDRIEDKGWWIDLYVKMAFPITIVIFHQSEACLISIMIIVRRTRGFIFVKSVLLLVVIYLSVTLFSAMGRCKKWRL